MKWEREKVCESKKPAVFLDRDGVLTVEKRRILLPNEVELYDGAVESVRELHTLGYWVIVVTNQSGIARGMYTENELLQLHAKLKRICGVDEIYYCPHHPNGCIDRYRKKCNCRKPELGMYENAIDRFAIDIENSYMVGDRISDIEFGKRAGLHTILVKTGYGGDDLNDEIVPDYVVDNIREVSRLLGQI